MTKDNLFTTYLLFCRQPTLTTTTTHTKKVIILIINVVVVVVCISVPTARPIACS